MALINLRSSLAWYDQKPGFAPNAAANESDYKGNVNDSTYFTVPQGYDNQGFATYFTPRVSANAFAIDDASYSFRGTASRRAQQGAGSKFPIGPKGQQHDFDIPRLGFHRKNKYGDLYSSLTTFGLADTYTKDSPIDDVYNIVKVRDVSYDPFGYASPPYILRGIQRDNNRYPQRWGTGNQIADTVSLALGVPRGGALAFGERAGNDVARLAKMMIRPMGLGWIAKQALLHLMNPNTEGVTGLIQRPNNHKVSNPLNTLLAAGVSGLGIHPRKHGLLPIGGLGRYEDVHKRRNVLEPLTPIKVGGFNRLSRLTDELYRHYDLPVLPYWNTITGPTGPDTVGGIGVTQFSRDVQGNLDQLLRFPGEQTSGQVVNSVQGIFSTLTPAQYLRIRRTDDSKYGNQGFAKFGLKSPLMFTIWEQNPGVYAYNRDYTIDRKKFPVVTSATNPKVFLVTRGTRPDTFSTDWKIQIPTKVNVRTSGDASPVLVSDVTFADLANNPKYFRSYLNPYSGKPNVGFQNDWEESQLESRYGSTAIAGIADIELTNGPGSGQTLPGGSTDPRFAVKPINPKNASLYIYNNPNVLNEHSNEVAMRSIYYPVTIGSNYGSRSNISYNNIKLSTILDAYRRPNNDTSNVIRQLYRDRFTPYGKNDGTGYSNTDTPGALNTSDVSQLTNRNLFVTNFIGLDPGNDNIGKRLTDPGSLSRTAGTDAAGAELTGLRAYKAMTYPQMIRISNKRGTGNTSNQKPTLLDFVTGKDFKGSESPMAKYVNKANGWSNGGADTDPKFWDKPNTDMIKFTIGGSRFKAYLTDWSDKATQTLNTFKPAGSPIEVVAGVSGYAREISVSFLVAARSHNELSTIYNNLIALQARVRPSVGGNFTWTPKLTSLTIGDLYNGISVYITDMSLSIDNEYPWEIEDKSQVPMYLNVDVSFVWPNGTTISGPPVNNTRPYDDGIFTETDYENENRFANLQKELDTQLDTAAEEANNKIQTDNGQP